MPIDTLAILLSPDAFITHAVLVTGIISLGILGALSSYFAHTLNAQRQSAYYVMGHFSHGFLKLGGVFI